VGLLVSIGALVSLVGLDAAADFSTFRDVVEDLLILLLFEGLFSAIECFTNYTDLSPARWQLSKHVPRKFRGMAAFAVFK